jgi:hypothetical protein
VKLDASWSHGTSLNRAGFQAEGSNPQAVGIRGDYGLVDEHVADVEISMPWKLLALVPGTVTDERCLHRRFHHLTLHGGWFRAGSDLLLLAKRLRSGRYLGSLCESEEVEAFVVQEEARFEP